ncbi:MAG: rhodanese-like domain-containing protein [Verrucomicrobia bacterium]|nr:rhodanese-like domain-containing protein [Verrucomicrobiota bacterium]
MRTISVHEAAEKRTGVVLDVRTPMEYEEVHLPDSVLLPLSELKPAKVAELAAGRPVHVLCRSGSRARQACEKLQDSGLAGLAVIDGGIAAWEAAGLPVVRGAKTISLERQVRIAAGTLVLTGVILGFVAHTGFFALSAFVGAGLVFAGITDWCGMGMLLARMPWNTRSRTSSECGNARC